MELVDSAPSNPPVNVAVNPTVGNWIEVSHKRRRQNPTEDVAEHGLRYHVVPAIPVIFSCTDGNINKLSPTVLSDAVQIRAGRISSARLIGQNQLLVKVATTEQANRLLGLTAISSATVVARLAKSFENPSGQITGVNPHCSEEGLLDALRGMGAIAIKRKTFSGRGGRKINSTRVVVVFGSHPMPTEVKIGLDTFKVSPYVSPPELCKYCARWGHNAQGCRSKARCLKCAGPHETKFCPCPKKLRCANCGQTHHACTMTCPARLRTIEQRRSVVLEGLSRQEALDKSKGSFKVKAANRPEAIVSTTNRSFADVAANRQAEKATKPSPAPQQILEKSSTQGHTSAVPPAEKKKNKRNRKIKSKKSATKTLGLTNDVQQTKSQKFQVAKTTNGVTTTSKPTNQKLARPPPTRAKRKQATPPAPTTGSAPSVKFSITPNFSWATSADPKKVFTSGPGKDVNKQNPRPTIQAADAPVNLGSGMNPNSAFDEKNRAISATVELLLKLVAQLLAGSEISGPAAQLLAFASSLPV